MTSTAAGCGRGTCRRKAPCGPESCPLPPSTGCIRSSGLLFGLKQEELSQETGTQKKKKHYPVAAAGPGDHQVPGAGHLWRCWRRWPNCCTRGAVHRLPVAAPWPAGPRGRRSPSWPGQLDAARLHRPRRYRTVRHAAVDGWRELPRAIRLRCTWKKKKKKIT